MSKAKILIIGPCESGKTWISNFLAEATVSSEGDYHVTQGVRILEMEIDCESHTAGKPGKIEVELWDCSGSKQFESCWPAFCKDCNGVILVCNPGRPDQKELERWYSYFVTQQNLQDNQCIIFVHHKPNTRSLPHQSPISPKLAGVQCVPTNLDEEPEAVRGHFNGYITSLMASWRDRQDQEERGIVSLQH